MKIIGKILKIIIWTALSLTLLFIVAVTAVVLILKPDNLTPLVEKYANNYLNAETSVQKVELTFWSTFPQLTLRVDSLDVKAKGVQEEYSKLLSLGRLEGEVNLLGLFRYAVMLKNVEIDRPQVTVALFPDGTSNLGIFPSSDEKKDSGGEFFPPEISFDRFTIRDASPLRFYNIADSMEVTVDLACLDLSGRGAPRYDLKVESRNFFSNRVYRADSIRLALNGKIDFDLSAPDHIGLEDMTLVVDSFPMEFSTRIKLIPDITLESLSARMPGWNVARLLELLPEEQKKFVDGVNTDMSFTFDATLKEPWQPLADSLTIPAVTARLSIPRCTVSRGPLVLQRVEADIAAETFVGDLDRSEVEIKRLVIAGRALGFNITGRLLRPLSRQYFSGKIKGGANLGKLPRKLSEKFASELSGRLTTDLKIRASLGDFDLKKLHRVYADGEIRLEEIRFASPDTLTTFFTDNTTLRLGSNVSFTNAQGQMADSLLSVSAKGDTLSLRSGSSRLNLAGFKVGAGTKIEKHHVDSTVIPIGAVIDFRRMRFSDSVDSLLIGMRDTRCRASITRYGGDSKKPLMRFVFDSKFMFGGAPQGRLGLLDVHFGVRAAFRESRRSRRDSLRRGRSPRQVVTANDSDLDLAVDSGIRAIFDKWNIEGSLGAKKGRAFVRGIPVTNFINELDLTFTPDTIRLKSLRYEIGASDFEVKGLLTNLRRALTRRRNNTLGINVFVKSDTLDVNFLSALAMAGGRDAADIPVDEAMAESMTMEAKRTTVDDIQRDSISAPILIPANIEARLALKADNLLYTSFNFRNFRGNVRIKDSAVQLRNLSGQSEIGKLDLTALYEAPNPRDITFGMGMKVDNFHISKMLELIPAIDSLLPMMKDFSGVISTEIAATTRIDSLMNVDIPTLKAAMKLTGDSLVLIDAETFKSLGKWLMFKNRHHNMIDHAAVEVVVDNGVVEIFPFIFDIDRYRLGVMGTNDLAMNLNYHISVLKSPLPFKFGINIKGNVDDMKIRLGGAKFKNGQVSAERMSIADTTRINLINQIENVFRRSARTGLMLNAPKPIEAVTSEPSDTLSAEQTRLIENQ